MSPIIIEAIERRVLQEEQSGGGLLDVYRVAQVLHAQFPDLTVDELAQTVAEIGVRRTVNIVWNEHRTPDSI